MFANDQQRRVLRITHLSQRDPTQVHAELEFVNFLKQRVACVCGTIAIKEQFVFSIGEFVCSLFEMASGRLIEYNDWGPDLFRNWGRSVGKFHRLSREFKPTGPRQLDWREDENLNFRARVPRDQEDLLTIGHRYLEKLEQYSTAPELYGLIHSDAHAGNFLLNQAELKIFDFDDCCYQWFAFDIATILFSAVLQQWLDDEQTEREAEANVFCLHFLRVMSMKTNRATSYSIRCLCS